MSDRWDAEESAGFSARDRRRELATRAAWLYYLGGHKQDRIAARLNVSRQAVQRLLATAVAEGLVTFRIPQPLGVCVELGERLRERFGLAHVEVVPGDADIDGLAGICAAAARQLETLIAAKAPMVVALGTGRTLQMMVGRVEPLERPQHKIVSLVGTTTRDGRASGFEVAIRLADRLGAASYPVPTIVVADTAEDCQLAVGQRPWQLIRSLADHAGLAMVGIGTLDREREVPLLRDGFITAAECDELIGLGAVGDIAGWAFDADGRLLEGGTNARLTAIPLRAGGDRPRLGVAGGAGKARAIGAALAGRLVSGLITDEGAARGILDGAPTRPPG